MTRLANRKGFSFIEVMIALTLLSTFGTSLFMVQSNIFQKIAITHASAANIMTIEKELIDFRLLVDQEIAQNKSAKDVKLHVKKNNPDRTIDISLKPFSEKSALFKDFKECVYATHVTITSGTKKETMIYFMFLPPKSKNKPKTPTAGTV